MVGARVSESHTRPCPCDTREILSYHSKFQSATVACSRSRCINSSSSCRCTARPPPTKPPTKPPTRPLLGDYPTPATPRGLLSGRGPKHRDDIHLERDEPGVRAIGESGDAQAAVSKWKAHELPGQVRDPRPLYARLQDLPEFRVVVVHQVRYDPG